MKATKDLLGINAKSYFMKKVILRDEFLVKAQDSTSRFDELLYEALSHPDLKAQFDHRIDFDAWLCRINEYKAIALREYGYIDLKQY